MLSRRYYTTVGRVSISHFLSDPTHNSNTASRWVEVERRTENVDKTEGRTLSPKGPTSPANFISSSATYIWALSDPTPARAPITSDITSKDPPSMLDDELSVFFYFTVTRFNVSNKRLIAWCSQAKSSIHIIYRKISRIIDDNASYLSSPGFIISLNCTIRILELY